MSRLRSIVSAEGIPRCFYPTQICISGGPREMEWVPVPNSLQVSRSAISPQSDMLRVLDILESGLEESHGHVVTVTVIICTIWPAWHGL